MSGPKYCSREDVFVLGRLPRGSLTNEGRLVASSNVSTDTFELNQHGFETGTEIVFRPVTGTLPAPLVEGTAYFAIRVSDSRFKVSLTNGGAAIDITTTGTEFEAATPLPFEEHIEAWSDWVAGVIPHVLPLTVDGAGKYPISVRRAVAELTAKSVLDTDGKQSAIIDAAQVALKAQLDRWASGIPIRDERITAGANLAVTSVATSDEASESWGGTIP